MHSLGRSGAGVFGSLASTQRSFRNSFSYRLAQNGIHALNNIGGNTDTVSQPRSVMHNGALPSHRPPIELRFYAVRGREINNDGQVMVP